MNIVSVILKLMRLSHLLHRRLRLGLLQLMLRPLLEGTEGQLLLGEWPLPCLVLLWGAGGQLLRGGRLLFLCLKPVHSAPLLHLVLVLALRP